MLSQNTNGARPHVETGRDTNPRDASRRLTARGEKRPAAERRAPPPYKWRAAETEREGGQGRPDTVNKNTISSSDMPILLEA